MSVFSMQYNALYDRETAGDQRGCWLLREKLYDWPDRCQREADDYNNTNGYYIASIRPLLVSAKCGRKA